MEDQPANAQLGITITASCVSTIALVHQIIQGVGRGQGTSQASVWRRNLSAVSCCAEWTLAVLCAVAMFHRGFWSPPRPKFQFLLRTDEPIARDLVFRLSTTAVAFTELITLHNSFTLSSSRCREWRRLWYSVTLGLSMLKYGPATVLFALDRHRTRSEATLLVKTHFFANLGEWILLVGTSVFLLWNSSSMEIRNFSKIYSVFYTFSAMLALVALAGSFAQEECQLLPQVFLLFITAQTVLCPAIVKHKNAQAKKANAGCSTRPPTASTVKGTQKSESNEPRISYDRVEHGILPGVQITHLAPRSCARDQQSDNHSSSLFMGMELAPPSAQQTVALAETGDTAPVKLHANSD